MKDIFRQNGRQVTLFVELSKDEQRLNSSFSCEFPPNEPVIVYARQKLYSFDLITETASLHSRLQLTGRYTRFRQHCTEAEVLHCSCGKIEGKKTQQFREYRLVFRKSEENKIQRANNLLYFKIFYILSFF